MLAKRFISGGYVRSGTDYLRKGMGSTCVEMVSKGPSSLIRNHHIMGNHNMSDINSSRPLFSRRFRPLSIELVVKKRFFGTTTRTIPGLVSETIEESKRREFEIVRQVKARILEVDANNDGKLDSEELKEALRKMGGFSDREIVDIGELFYAARGGKAISHEDFLKGVAAIVHDNHSLAGEKASGDEEQAESSNAATHRKTLLHSKHPLGLGTCSTEYMYGKQRSVYTNEELDIKITHVSPVTFVDKLAFATSKLMRNGFDIASFWHFGEITQAKILRRAIFLETVAAIPGFVAAMVRHFKSLRNMTRDGGMLNMFLDEANNERMHLLSFVKLRNPGTIFRVLVMASQTAFGIAFFLLYHISPAFCHRLVGYIEEEACHTYTTIIQSIEEAPPDSDLSRWRTDLAPAIARAYWHLGEEGTVLDMIYAVRADEAEHRDVNHVCSGMREGQINPLLNPQEKFDQTLMKYVRNMMEREQLGNKQ